MALKNPFELWSAVKFGILLAVIGLLGRAARETFQDDGFTLASLLMGFADADAPSVQAAGMAAEAVRSPAGGEAPFLRTASVAVVLVMTANTVTKGVLTVALGGRELRRFTVPAFAAMAAAGVAAALLLA